MVFSCTATPEPSNVPPRVLIEAVESDPDLSIQTVAFFRDGAPLRFEPAVTGDQAVAYDYDAPFDVALTYRVDGMELGSPIDWTEDWVSLADWSGSGWAVGGGSVASTTPLAVLYRDSTAAAPIIQLFVTSPSNLTLQLTDVSDNVVVSVLVSPDGTVTLTGSTASKVTGSGSFTVSLSENSAHIAGIGWSTSVALTGVPTRVRMVAPAAYSYISQFGGTGTGDGQFQDAHGIAIDGSGNIFVVDSANSRVQKFNSAGVYQSQFGSNGTGNGQFNTPIGIALDASGNIFVADRGNHRVQKFNSAGVYQSQFGSNGVGNGQFNFPRGIVINGSGDIWVTDTGNSRVQKFNSAGVYQSQFGTVGSGDGQFSSPRGIALDGSGNIFVADAHQRVQKFNSSGVFQSKFGTLGTGDGQFGFGGAPAGIAIDASNNLYVVDTYNARVQKFNSAGVYQSQFGSNGVGNGQFNFPQFIALDSSNYLYVSDGGSLDNVQKFTLGGGSTDDVSIRIDDGDGPIDVTATDTATLSPSGATAGAWLMNAATPDLAILAEAEPASSDDEFFIVTSTRENGQLSANSVSLPIEGSADVLTVVLGPRFKETWTLDIACTTQAAYQTLTALMANSSVILLRFPTSSRWDGLDGGFYAVGDVDATRVGHPQLGPVIIASLPLLPARAPKFKPLWQWNWNTLVQTGMSWDDVAANFDSWNDVLVGPN